MESMLAQLLTSNTNKPPLTPKTKTVEEIGEERNTKIIIIQHNNTKGYVSLLDNQKQLSRDDALTFIKSLKSVTKDKTLEIILHTPGGDISAAEIIVNAMLKHQGKIIVYIPYYAMSAGTIIALAADEIIIGENAFMGRGDPQFAWGYSCRNIINYTNELTDYPSWVNDLAKLVRQDAQQELVWVENLVNKIDKVKNRTISSDGYDLLFSGTNSHQQPLFIDCLSTVIPFIKEGVPDELRNLIVF